MKNKTAGFTLMESLVSIAIVLVTSSCILLAFTNGTRSLMKAADAVSTSGTLLQIDRFIREGADKLHIPYWLPPDNSIEAFIDELRRSKIGKYIEEVTIINNYSGIARGLTVGYRVKGKKLQTSVLFPAVPVVER
ncbi:hypothetical protein FACS1894106_5730 [Spirochaetia bacterium]|nr:hypothetical protein FACS1894106_5730 [Spirochaetia bacterium]